MGAVRGRILNGRYRIDDLLGRGGMATVWRGQDLHLDRPVAIKLLERATLTDPTLLDRFGREARAVARLAHPNVVAVYDFGTDHDDPYLIIELVDGQSLAALLAAGPLPAERAVSIAAQICDGLAATHAAGVIHRDIKPANLMITPTGAVKICDFGIARLHHAAQATLTATATVIGTSEYMAPEQAAGDAVDGRADLYALGCVLYAMLAGVPPFAGGNPLQVISQHLNQPVPPVRARRPDVPADLDALVTQLLAKQPGDRPAGADQVRARLTGIAGDPRREQPATSPHATAAGPQPARPGPVRAAAAVVPPTRTFARPVDPHEPIGAAASRRGWLRPVAVSVAALAVLLLVAAIALLKQTPERSTGEQATGSRATGSAPANPSTPADPVAAFQDLQQQIQAAGLRPNVAKDIRKEVEEIDRELRRNDLEQAAEKVGKLREKLDEMRDDGKLDDTAYQPIAASVDRLAATLPATTG